MKWFFFAVGVLTACGCYDYSSDSNDIYCSAESGECVVCTDSDCSTVTTVTQPAPPFRDVCDSNFKANMLLGTCWTEQCVNGEKSLVPKIAGVPCVLNPLGGNSPWEEGTCTSTGECVGSVP